MLDLNMFKTAAYGQGIDNLNMFKKWGERWT